MAAQKCGTWNIVVYLGWYGDVLHWRHLRVDGRNIFRAQSVNKGSGVNTRAPPRFSDIRGTIRRHIGQTSSGMRTPSSRFDTDTVLPKQLSTCN